MHSKETLKRKLKELEKLLALIYQVQEKRLLLLFANNPRAHYASLNSLVFTACVLIPCGLAEINDWGFGFIAIVAPVSSFIYFRKKSTAGETWQEEFDNKLMNYDPVDFHNFRWLQKSTEKNGSLDYGTLRDWIAVERYAITNLLYPKSYEESAIDKNHSDIEKKQSEPVLKKLKFIERNL